jgi:hypothetical protein
MRKSVKVFMTIFGLSLFIVSCKHSVDDVRYEYHCKQGVTDTTLEFESQYGLDKITLDSILDELVYSGGRVLKNPSTFELNELNIHLDTIKDTMFLSLDGLKKIKFLKVLNINLSFYGKNLLGGSSDLLFEGRQILIKDDRVINLDPISVELNIEEEIRDKVQYSFEYKHTIDTTIFIKWNLLHSEDFSSNISMIRNSASTYGNKERSLKISENNMKKAIYLLENKEGDFSITKDILDKNGFSLSCGSGVIEQYYYYDDDYISGSLEANSKEELIKKLKFILKYIYTNKLKYNSWEVTKHNGNLVETFNK